MSNWKSATRDFADVLPTREIWDLVRSYLINHRAVHPWRMSRMGFGYHIPERISFLIYDLVPLPARPIRRNLHLLTGNYPADFVFPDALEHWVPVQHAWWVHLFPYGDGESFLLWLLDGFPIWIENRLHRQVLPHEVPPWADIVAYWLT